MNETNQMKKSMQIQRTEQWLPEGKEPGKDGKIGKEDEPYGDPWKLNI